MYLLYKETYTLLYLFIEIDCSQPVILENSEVDTSRGTLFGSVALYSCIENHALVGFPLIICGEEGNWIQIGDVSCEGRYKNSMSF